MRQIPSLVIRFPLAIVLVVALGLLDFATGSQFRISLFYLLPILWVTWKEGRGAGLAISLVSALTWLASDLADRARYVSGVLPYWNAMVTLGFFWITVFLLAEFQRERAAARTCPLTGLLNRFGFFEAAEAEFERCRRYSRAATLLFLDCDGFKAVNDRMGHPAGDRLLRAVGNTLRSNLRESDLSARLGGDEFAILLPETGAQAGREVVEKLVPVLAASMKKGGWPVTFSVGVLTFPTAPPSVDAGLRAADELMYQVKKTGKNGVRFGVLGEEPAAGKELPRNA